MRNLKNIGFKVDSAPYQLRFGKPLDIAGEKDSDISVGQSYDDRFVIPRLAGLRRRPIRPHHFDFDSLDQETFSGSDLSDGNLCLVRDIGEAAELGIIDGVDSDDDLSRIKVSNHVAEPTDVVFVSVCGHDVVDACKAPRPQEARDDIFADTEDTFANASGLVRALRSAHLPRPATVAQGAAAIDKHRRAFREEYQGRVALPDVEERNRKFPGRPMRPGDRNRQ